MKVLSLNDIEELLVETDDTSTYEFTYKTAPQKFKKTYLDVEAFEKPLKKGLSFAELVKEYPDEEQYFVEEYIRQGLERTKGRFKPNRPKRCLVIGYDTEYDNPSELKNLNWSDLNEKEFEDLKHKIKNDKIFNRVLSYQYSAEIVESIHKLEVQKSQRTDYENYLIEEENKFRQPFLTKGIILPKGRQTTDRLSFEEFLRIVLSEVYQKTKGTNVKIPNQIYLIGHFLRADLPAFSEFREQKEFLKVENVRNTFTHTKSNIPLKLELDGCDKGQNLRIIIRDTLLLAPSSNDEGGKSLDALGEALGQRKIEVSNEDKQNMSAFMERDWDLFKKYGVTDADICTEWGVKVLRLSERHLKKFSIPVTLSAMGVKYLERMWKGRGLDRLDLLGKEKLLEVRFHRQSGQYRYSNVEVFKDKIHWHTDFVTEGYHGGRNEQFIFGVSEEGDWTDYDLSSAYPTAMNLIKIPKWEELEVLKGDYTKNPTDLSFYSVEFEFPKNVRYPTLPIRTANGIIFPRRGVSNCASPELLLAKQLGAEVSIRHGVHIPTEREGLFGPYLIQCLKNRKRHRKGSIDNLFWKEMVNSTYGKTAQGLRKKRVFDLKEEANIDLNESSITNPYIASFITSFVRAVLGEVMNNIPQHREVFSVTTDGFLSNANRDEVDTDQKGMLLNLYRRSRIELVGEDDTFEVKHRAKQLLGWRTRGQATIKKQKEDDTPVLAKGGIKVGTIENKLTKDEQNKEVALGFFKRNSKTKNNFTGLIGMNDQWMHNLDLLRSNHMEKVLSMEFDFKRAPFNLSMKETEFEGEKFNHLYFDTKAWDTVTEFQRLRVHINQFNKFLKRSVKGDEYDNRLILKTVNDFENFYTFITHKTSAKGYVPNRIHADLIMLKRELISAFKRKDPYVGFDLIVTPSKDRMSKVIRYENGSHIGSQKMFNYEFGEMLNSMFERLGFGRLLKTADLYQKDRTVLYNSIPSTEPVKNVLSLVRDEIAPNLIADRLICNNEPFGWDYHIH